MVGKRFKTCDAYSWKEVLCFWETLQCTEALNVWKLLSRDRSRTPFSKRSVKKFRSTRVGKVMYNTDGFVQNRPSLAKGVLDEISSLWTKDNLSDYLC